MRPSALLFSLLPLSLLAQVPQAFEFQGVARDLSGNMLVSQAISLRLGIVSGTSGGPLLYQETQATTTSPLGLFTVQVGNGTPVLGTFAAIAWSTGPRFLKVEMDPAAGTSYQHMGTTQLLSVPYALAAGGVPCFTASATGDTLRQGNGCYLIIPGLSAANPTCTDADGDGFFSMAGCGTAVDCNDANPNIKPGATELCDGIDNNCSGSVDEGNPGGGIVCTTGQPGVCSAGHTQCVAGALVCVPNVSASAEVCDGLDNNCNGTVDEGNPGGGIACNTGQAGVCATGTTQCVGGAIICVQNQLATAEVCNGLDDNCNGAVDDGATCPSGQTCSGGACVSTTTTEIEPNGTTAQADANSSVLIPASNPIAGAINPAADLDFFKVSLAGSSDVVRFETFDASGTDCTGGMTTTLRYFNSSGTQILTDAASGISGCAAITYPAVAGTSYIEVEETGTNAVVAAYRLRTSVVSAATTEVEPNDAFTQATVLTGSERFAIGNHSIITDVDWYAITVPNGSSVRAELIEGNLAAETCESNGVDSQITLFASNGTTQLVTDDDDGRGFCSLIDGTGTAPLDTGAHNLAAGTYYLKVQSPASTTGAAAQFDYKLVVTIR